MLKRLKNPMFILALAGFVYQILSLFGVAPDFAMYQQLVDLVSYLFIGVGIYSQYGAPKGEGE